MNNKYQKAVSFVLTSGVGWLIDFSLYTILVYVFSVSVKYANFISAVPSVTFVFFVSTRKIFNNSESRIGLQYKYIIYILYQIVLVSAVSVFAEFLCIQLSTFLGTLSDSLAGLSEILTKCIITCITLCCNFLTMRFITEKL